MTLAVLFILAGLWGAVLPEQLHRDAACKAQHGQLAEHRFFEGCVTFDGHEWRAAQ